MVQFCLRRVHGKWGTLQPQCCTLRRTRWWQQGTPTGRREAQGLQGMQYAMFIQDERKLKSFWKYSSYPAAILNYGMSFWTRFYMNRSREALYSRPGAAEDKNCAIMWRIVTFDGGQNAWSRSCEQLWSWSRTPKHNLLLAMITSSLPLLVFVHCLVIHIDHNSQTSGCNIFSHTWYTQQ